jgi:SNF2 family DNA or RNA helicase
MTGSPIKNNLDELFGALNSIAPDKFPDLKKFKAEYGKDTAASRRALQRAIAPYVYAAGTKPRDKSGRTLVMNEHQPRIQVSGHVAKERQKILDHTETISDYLKAKTREIKGQGREPTTEDFNDAWNNPQVVAAIDSLASKDTWHQLTDEQKQQAIGGQVRAVGALKNNALFRLFHRTPYENNPKAQWTVSHAKDMKKAGKAGIVFSSSSQAASMLKDAMGKQGLKVGIIDGSLSASQKSDERSKFQNGEYDVLVCTDAAQTGLNLTKGKYLVHYDCPLTQKAYEQRSARIHRLKQDQDTDVFVPQLDLPEERIAWARVQRKAAIGAPLQSKAELVDDSGLAREIEQMRGLQAA